MVQIFIIFLVIIIVMAAVIGMAVAIRSRNGNGEFDEQYYDKDGNHVYYDRSKIEKEEFVRNHPEEKPRSLRRLFSKKN